MDRADCNAVSPSAIEREYVGNGGEFTDFLAKLLNPYLLLGGCNAICYSINRSRNMADGGIDGQIHSTGYVDELGFIGPQSVLQFKASSRVNAGDIVKEISEAAAGGERRVRDYIVDGYKYVLFLASALTDRKVMVLERAIGSAVRDINPNAPKPTVVDANRLAMLIAKVPAIAIERHDFHANSLDAVLSARPHSVLRFTPLKHFDMVVSELKAFVESSEPVKRFHGAPGVGKTRCVLEALKSIESIASGVLCANQAAATEILIKAREKGFQMLLVVDDFVDDGRTLRPQDVPDNCKVVVIRHGFGQSNPPTGSSLLHPPCPKDLRSVLAQFEDKGLTYLQIEKIAEMAREDLRAATYVCGKVGPRDVINPLLFEEIVDQDLREMREDKARFVKLLSLVRFVHRDHLKEFCRLLDIDSEDFEGACKSIGRASGHIVWNDAVAYVSMPIVAEYAFKTLLSSDDTAWKKIAESQRFQVDFLWRARCLPDGPAKSAALDIVVLPLGVPTIEEFSRKEYWPKFLLLLESDPKKYLPHLRNIFSEDRAGLASLPYESYERIGRHEIIRVLVDLAQFNDYFVACEELVYWMCRDEVETPYSNTATAYWAEWFKAYLAYTEYPLEGRLQILRQRVDTGDDRDQVLAAKALTDPFPRYKVGVPSARVGGRDAPVTPLEVRRKDVATMLGVAPGLLLQLLEAGSDEVCKAVGTAIKVSLSSWVHYGGGLDPLEEILRHERFPISELRVLARSLIAAHLRAGSRENEGQGADRVAGALQAILKPFDAAEIEAMEAEALIEMWSLPEISVECVKLVRRFVDDVPFLDRLRPFIVTAGYQAHLLGAEVGKIIDEARLLREFYTELADEATDFLRGLVRGSFGAGKVGPLFRRQLDADEEKFPLATLSLRRELHDGQFPVAALRLLKAGRVQPEAFVGAWVHAELESKEVLAVLRELAKRVPGDDGALEVLLGFGAEFARRRSADRATQALMLKVLLAVPDSSAIFEPHQQVCYYPWLETAEWLLDAHPDKVVEKLFQTWNPLPGAELVAMEAAVERHPKTVMRELLRKVSEDPNMLWVHTGKFSWIIELVPEEMFAASLHGIADQAAIGLAAQLPAPRWEGEEAFVPAQTRLFWEAAANQPWYDKAMAAFTYRTQNTGVIRGFGVELFDSLVRLCEALRHDTNPGIAEWADASATSNRNFFESARQERSHAIAVEETSP